MRAVSPCTRADFRFTAADGTQRRTDLEEPSFMSVLYGREAVQRSYPVAIPVTLADLLAPGYRPTAVASGVR